MGDRCGGALGVLNGHKSLRCEARGREANEHLPGSRAVPKKLPMFRTAGPTDKTGLEEYSLSIN
jgi:hypothetical protein